MLRRALQPVQALREVFGNPNLRRNQLALGCYYAGDSAFVVALLVFAYQQGGAAEVGLAALVQMLPGAAAVPFAALLADRFRRERVLLLVDLARGVAVAAAAVCVLVDAPAPVVYALAGAGATAAAAFRPSQWALVPLLARTPGELIAVNVASGTIEGLALLIGSAGAATLLAVGSTELAFLAAAGSFLVAAVAAARVSVDTGGRAATRREPVLTALAGGIRTLAAEPHPRLLIALFAAQTLVRGMLNVLVVVAAIELLGLGQPGVGFLNSAFGAGGLFGALVALALVGRARLGGPFALALVLWGAPIALLGATPHAAVGVVAMALVGAGNALLDVAGFTLVQRLVSDAVLARVFGVLETFAMAGLGVGALATPLLISALGVRGALLATGAILPSLALLSLSRLRRIDDAAAVPLRELELLRETPLFAPLPALALERAARKLVRVAYRTGEPIIREGDRGDRFFVVAEGEIDVVHAGAHVATLRRGGFVGEIALLEDVPRTADVIARSNVELLALDRGDFLSAVTGSPQSAVTASALIGERLAELRAVEKAAG